MNTRSRRHTKAAGLALAALLGGCATNSEITERDPFARGARDETVMLTVENNDFRDASIYAVWSGMKIRVGSVTGKTSETFRMQWRSEIVQLEVDFVGQGGYRSEVVDVMQGDHLNFVILPGA